MGAQAMNDDFLYRFRADPSPDFAARLKARLDASASARKRGLRWGVFTLIFGAALAFAVPAVRQSISRLVGAESESARVAVVPKPDVSPLPTPAVRQAPEVPPSAATKSAAPASVPTLPPAPPLPGVLMQPSGEPGPSEMDPHKGDFGFIAHAPPMPVIAEEEDSGEAVPHSSTMLDEEHEALMIRRSLFRVMGWATDDLGRRVYGDLTRNWEAVLADARLLSQLTPMIPEVFQLDTRGFGLDTRARPLVWRDPKGFDNHIEKLEVWVEYLELGARRRDFTRTLRAIQGVVDSCDACHARYRRNDPHGSAQ
jgi:cytochrome c556